MKKINTFCILFLAIYFIGCQSQDKPDDSQQQDTVQADTSAAVQDTTAESDISLELLWETDTTLTTVESVIYDEFRNVIYAACIAGDDDAKDEEGFIATIDPEEGIIIEREWVSGMNAPKGMAIADSMLYVSDIDVLHEIDIRTGEIKNTYEAPGALFLNDVAATWDGVVYVSGMQSHQIYQLKNGKLTVFMEDVKNPNGLYIEDDYILIAYWEEKAIKKINLKTKEVTELISGIENPDGIESPAANEYLISNWSGEVYYVFEDGTKERILETKSDKINAADIEYISDKNMLLVPTFFSNKVMAYQMSME